MASVVQAAQAVTAPMAWFSSSRISEGQTMTTTITTKDAGYWIALCWNRVPAGPEPGGPPWLFILQEHAEAYAAQLRARGIEAQARGWTAAVTEWKGVSLVKFPTIPPPDMAAPDQATLSSQSHRSSAHAETHNGTTVSSMPSDVPPPPTME